MVTSPSPTVLKRYVALELRKLRTAAGLKREQVAKRLGCVTSHVMHLETMRNLPRRPELEVLLQYYGAGERTTDFLKLLEAARTGLDWWRLSFPGAAPPWFDLYLGLESSGDRIESYDALVVPGLFQTPTYARAIIRTGEPELTDDKVTQRVDLRMARQDVLTREPEPPTVWCVLDESVLWRSVGGPDVLAEQLEHLVKLGELPTVNIQVLRLVSGAHAGVSGPFVILSFPPELRGDPGVAYTESRIRGIYYEDPKEIMRYRDTLTRIQIQALTPEESRTVLLERIANTS